MNKGCFVISLDYELMWGMFDVVTKEGYGRTHIQNVPVAIDEMITLFHKYGVHVTIAAVGMLMYNNTEELLADLPEIKPTYLNPNVSPYHSILKHIEFNDKILFFQPDVIEWLKEDENVEIGTHTYCHYYCCEEGQTVNQFEEDLKKAIDLAKKKDIKIKSIIFPRNQVSKDYLIICAKYGITSYRGNAPKYYNTSKNPVEQIKNRICRFLDAYINIGGVNSVPVSAINVFEKPINLPASRFLRPYNKKISLLDGLRLRRIQNEMIYAAKHNELYHLWWHPHNFGANIKENLNYLEKILKCFDDCREKYGMQTFTMKELTNLIISENE